MRKIRYIFKRDFQRNVPALPEPERDMEWVFDPLVPVVPTLKYDGTAVLVDSDGVWKRRKLDANEWRRGYRPTSWKAAQDEPFGDTMPGWMPVQEGDPEDQWHVKGFEQTVFMYGSVPYGTYELIGPKIQGNPHNVSDHQLVRHGKVVLQVYSVSHSGMEAYLVDHEIEGIVFYELHGDRMGKITRRDFGLNWPTK